MPASLIGAGSWTPPVSRSRYISGSWSRILIRRARCSAPRPCSPPSPAPFRRCLRRPRVSGAGSRAGRGGRRFHTALVHFWTGRHLLRLPVPLTGAAALRAMRSSESGIWTAAFVRALAAEAADCLGLLVTMERAWLEAQRAIAPRRKTSHATAAVDVLVAAPMISATSLARVPGIAGKNALRLLDELCAAEIAVEVTHRLSYDVAVRLGQIEMPGPGWSAGWCPSRRSPRAGPPLRGGADPGSRSPAIAGQAQG